MRVTERNYPWLSATRCRIGSLRSTSHATQCGLIPRTLRLVPCEAASASNVTCYYPIKAYRSSEINPETGKRRITFNPHKSHVEGSSFQVPCGRCTGCMIDRSQQLATRCMHEAQMHRDNCFITLTYSNEALPINYSVNLSDWQNFMKRLRKSLEPKKVRFFACGEYGENTLRPHYHALIFNHQFSNLQFRRQNKNQDNLYTSEELSKLWPQGFHEIGQLTYKSAGYCARYCLKKIVGDKADDHYMRQSPVDGNWYRVSPEFAVGSRRPGLGAGWFDKFQSDAFPSDFVIVDGRKKKPPRYYLNKLKEVEQTKIQRKRKREALRQRADNTKERLAVREKVQLAKLKQLKRDL